MDIPALLQSHIYTAIELGSVVDGETTVVVGGGYAFGGTIARVISVAAHYGALAVLVILVAGIVIFAVHRWRGGHASTVGLGQP